MVFIDEEQKKKDNDISIYEYLKAFSKTEEKEFREWIERCERKCDASCRFCV